MRSQIVVVAGVLTALALAGCGGDDGASKAELAQARQAGEEKAKEEAADKRRDRKLRHLDKKLDEVKKGEQQPESPSPGPAAPPSPAAPPAPTSPAATTSCGSGIGAGANTSCLFAQNVAAVYSQSGGASSISVYSPVTDQTYTMSCTAGAPTVCRGGNNASVYLP